MIQSSISHYSLLFLALLVLLVPSQGHADIYRHVDANGVVHFTDTPTSGQYRFFMKEKKQRAERSSVTDLILHYASVFNLDDSLVRAVIKVESDYNPNALSSKGAQGLMQLIPETARDMNVTDPFNPEDNIRGGSRYLRLMLDQFDGSLELALAAYNAGPGAVRRYGGIPPFEETRNYVEKVKKYLRHYRQNRDAVL
ncbi:transglycosylase SLT domain-containing protein [Trichloromonas sp.]|uniref:transglycosylase SLT domain-containing protein n=1 Tax=Trichloromonas sp. TaxID=3069249 RepID=UPI003D815E13